MVDVLLAETRCRSVDARPTLINWEAGNGSDYDILKNTSGKINLSGQYANGFHRPKHGTTEPKVGNVSSFRDGPANECPS